MTVKDIIERKKYLFLLICAFVLLYTLIKALTFYIHSLRVFEFAFLAMVFGFAPSYFFRRILKFKNIVGWLVNSSALGVLFIPFVFIILGWVGINQVFVYSTLFLYSCSILGIVILVFLADDTFVKSRFNLNGMAKIDVVFYIVLAGYTFILTLLNFYRVYIQWDAFTFWGLDAKYIFQINRLRDSSIDVFGSFRYTAYYPAYYSLVYDLYGAVVEQYANWINVFLNFLALLLIYNNTSEKSFATKSFVVTISIMVSYTAVLVVNMLSMYADVLCAFNLLLFVMILTTEYEYELVSYGQRVFLLFLLAISLYFIKSPFIFLTCSLISIYVLYDLKLLFINWRILIGSISLWAAIATILSLYLMRYYYFSVSLKIGSNTPINDLYLPHSTSLYLSMKYVVELIFWFINRSPYLVVVWILGILSVFLVDKKRVSKSYYYIYWMSIGVVLSYIVIYVINQSDLSSGSLIRYCAIIMYLVPLLFTFVKLEVSILKPFAQLILSFAISGYFFVKTMSPMPLYEPFTLSTGSYSVFLKKESRIAERTLRIVDGSARILIADDFLDDTLLSNMYLDAIFVRYFLMFNSVGGQYNTTIENIYKYALQQNADYILLLSYANTLDGCERLLIENHSYLIKIGSGKSSSHGECIFSNDIIFDLSK